ncbi:MAG: (2Fe-2S)-binding protein [Cognatishimia sp.]
MSNMITVNGKQKEVSTPKTTLLIEFLRDELGLTGTHEGCDSGQCGACTVFIDGITAKSCMVTTASVVGGNVTTIEGVGGPNDLHPMQEAFHNNHGLQCGFCTPGMVITGIDIANRSQKEGRKLDEQTIRNQLGGNICRCTGYQNIVTSIQEGASKMAETR